MTGVYIKGMEMPKEGFVEIIIRDDGTVQQTGQSYQIDGTDYYTPYVGEMPVIYEAFSVPSHGRCIDVDALIKELTLDDKDDNSGATLLMAIFLEVLKAAPTIIPAEEGE